MSQKWKKKTKKKSENTRHNVLLFTISSIILFLFLIID
jgi:hypothetical protein